MFFVTLAYKLALVVALARAYSPEYVPTATYMGVMMGPGGGYLAKTIHYDVSRMERVARCHMSPRCGDAGDYVPTLKLRRDVTGYTAVNWWNRWMVQQNVVAVASVRNPRTGEERVERLQAVDWQMRRDATPCMRLETDGTTALRNGFSVRQGWGRTDAVIVRYELPDGTLVAPTVPRGARCGATVAAGQPRAGEPTPAR